MHNKTFHITIRNQQGYRYGSNVTFYIHAESYEEAAEWVAGVFQGITAPEPVVKKAIAGSRVKVGDNRPISIVDCDRYSTRRLVDGKYKNVATELGVNRRSPDEITAGFNEVYKACLSNYNHLMDYFDYVKKLVEVGHTPAVKLREIQEASNNCLQWAARFSSMHLTRLQERSDRTFSKGVSETVLAAYSLLR